MSRFFVDLDFSGLKLGLRSKMRVSTVGLLLIFFAGAFSPVWAAEPQDALSARADSSAYLAFRMNDLGGTLRSIFSPANVAAVTSVMTGGEAQTARLVAALMENVPLRSLAFAAGTTADGEPFLQLAASVAKESRAKLDSVGKGEATTEDLVRLLLGEGGLMLAAAAPPLSAQRGERGAYYLIDDKVALAAHDDLLVMALSAKDLEDSLDALKDAKKRLSLKRRFKSPAWYYLHCDFPAMAELGARDGKGVDEKIMEALKNAFRVPLRMEVDFESKADGMLISVAANIIEVFSFGDRLKDIKPQTGAGFFLVGDGEPFFGLSTISSFSGGDLKIHAELQRVWENILAETSKRGITEADIENMLNGSFSFVVGNRATILGNRAPGVYLAMTGRKGAAAKILNAVLADESFSMAVPLAPLTVKGWDNLYRVDPMLVPVPLIFGTKGDSLFVGMLDPEVMGGKPAFPAPAQKMLKSKLFAAGFLDVDALWKYLGSQIEDESTALGGGARMLMGEALYDAVKDIFGADLPVTFVKFWAPTQDTAFEELSMPNATRTDAEDKRLLPRIMKAVKVAQGGGYGAFQDEENALTVLMTFKRMIEAYLAANPEMPLAELKEAFDMMFFAETPSGLYVGAPVDDGDRLSLIEQAKKFGLTGSANPETAPDGKPYEGQAVVWVKIEK